MSVTLTEDFSRYLLPCESEFDQQDSLYNFAKNHFADSYKPILDNMRVLSLSDVLSSSRDDYDGCDGDSLGDDEDTLSEGSCPCSDEAAPPTKRKRSVTFADELGNDLTTCFYFVPDSDYTILCDKTLNWDDFVKMVRLNSPGTKIGHKVAPSIRQTARHTDGLSLVPLFEQPCADFRMFEQCLSDNMVSLENIICQDFHVFGTIRALIAEGADVADRYEAKVRFSWDNWSSVVDFLAVEAPIRWPGSVLRMFSFAFKVPSELARVGKQLELVVCFTINGVDYCDDNGGGNYVLHVVRGTGHCRW